jgi:hypothetical protein
MAAGILYMMLAMFALAVLVIMLMPPPPLSWALLVSVPEMLFLVTTLASLTLVSVAMALVFFRRKPQAYLNGRPLQVIVLALPLLALSWNWIASLFWILPVFFALRAASSTKT